MSQMKKDCGYAAADLVKDGQILGDDILKVGSFLNQLITNDNVSQSVPKINGLSFNITSARPNRGS